MANKVTENPWHKDYFFLKFCRARKFDLPKVIEMFTNYMKYRTDNDLDNIITVSLLSNFLSFLGFRFPTKG